MIDMVSGSKASLLPELAGWEETQAWAPPRPALPWRELMFLPVALGAAVAVVAVLVALAG